jgi:hypothetical protein
MVHVFGEVAMFGFASFGLAIAAADTALSNTSPHPSSPPTSCAT